ncbi:Membrane protein implicated in regulation of membrane protease activity [Ruminococcus sp. YRD2003]|uniref:NfeD family protein n=1 Tax=Ruminococcus sp. YRD2003 TaxID=1452313 RepID=UPI0008D24C98|nr:Membrane protein implicated in regulation of membrane protease activity [Ruminococcus flavefaciens]
MDVIIWAILVIAFVIAEVATVQLVSVWFAAGALVTMILVFFFDIPIIGQVGIFIGSSALFLALTMPFIIAKRKKKGYIPTNSELEVGRVARVIEEINTDNGTGRVRVGGVDWSAVSADDSVIPADTVVTVTAVNGAKLTVKPKD